MKTLRTCWRAVVVTLIFSSASALQAQEQNYPRNPVRVIAPFAPGGGTDVIARLLATQLGERLKGTFFVDNLPGANGIVGTTIAARAAPDGYTLVLGSTGPNAVNPALRDDLKYDPIKDFVPVSIVATIPNVLVVNPQKVSATSVRELIALAKAQPQTLTYGSTGIGSPAHLAAELFSSASDIKMVHVPYKGVGAALPDLLGGNIQLMFPDLLSALPHIRSGRLRALGITAATRSALVAEVPTLQEAGVPAFDMGLWYALFAPSGTPPAIIELLNAETQRILKDPAVKEKLAEQGTEPLPTSVDEGQAFVRKEVVRWDAAVKKLGIKVE